MNKTTMAIAGQVGKVGNGGTWGEDLAKSLHGCNVKFMLAANVNHFAMPRLQLLQSQSFSLSQEALQLNSNCNSTAHRALRPLTLHKFSSKPNRKAPKRSVQASTQRQTSGIPLPRH
ncbi:hypothetical protein ACLKA6_000982 [Drosophila palustris]